MGAASSAVKARWAVARAISSFMAAVLISLLGASGASASEGCPNEARRVEQGSTSLPDCRAYELVSPPSMPTPFYYHYYKGLPNLNITALGIFGEQPQFMPQVQASESIAANGEAVLFGSNEPNLEGDGIRNDMSRRGPDGWTGDNIEPPQSPHSFLCGVANYIGYSQNLEYILFKDGTGEVADGRPQDIEACGHDEPRLVPGESEVSGNIFLRDTANKSWQLVNPPQQPGSKPHDPWGDVVSSDGSHVVFQSKAQLTPDAPFADINGSGNSTEYCENGFGDVYVWSAGAVHLLTVLPDGKPIRGTLAGAHPQDGCNVLYLQSGLITHSVSADGERILFYAGGGFKFTEVGGLNQIRPNAPYIHGGLYLREHPDAEQSTLNECSEADRKAEPETSCTVQIDLNQGGPGNSGGGQFQWASADTARIFFTDEEELVAGSTAEAGKPDLYEYDLEKPVGERLTDLTAGATEPADVLGVSGASEDGSYVYFVAEGVLSGAQENNHGARAAAGKANLYLRHAGATTFIATLNAIDGDQCDWTAYCLTARVSANGAFIAFDSIDSLTGYDNHPVHSEACRYSTEVPGAPCMETFRYAAADGANGELTCASCNPSGARPESEFAWSVIQQPAREVPGPGIGSATMQATHAVSDSGQVFFETMEKLVPTDENNTWDVYEYDGGEGPGAQLHLISSGTSGLPSYYIDATPDGSNVFFVTGQSLLRADTRNDYDLYDARIGGGFAAQNEPIVPPSCTSLEGCHSPLTEPPAELSVASATLTGAGNLTPKPEQHEGRKTMKCRKGFVRKQGRCVRRKHRAKRRRHGGHRRRAVHRHRRTRK